MKMITQPGIPCPLLIYYVDKRATNDDDSDCHVVVRKHTDNLCHALPGFYHDHAVHSVCVTTSIWVALHPTTCSCCSYVVKPSVASL